MEINPLNLCITPYNQPSIIFLNTTISPMLDFVYSFTINGLLTKRQGNKRPSVIGLQGCKLISQWILPLRHKSSLRVGWWIKHRRSRVRRRGRNRKRRRRGRWKLINIIKEIPRGIMGPSRLPERDDNRGSRGRNMRRRRWMNRRRRRWRNRGRRSESRYLRNGISKIREIVIRNRGRGKSIRGRKSKGRCGERKIMFMKKNICGN